MQVAQECGDLVSAQTWRILGTLLVSADSKVHDGMFADQPQYNENGMVHVSGRVRLALTTHAVTR